MREALQPARIGRSCESHSAQRANGADRSIGILSHEGLVLDLENTRSR